MKESRELVVERIALLNLYSMECVCGEGWNCIPVLYDAPSSVRCVTRAKRRRRQTWRGGILDIWMVLSRGNSCANANHMKNKLGVFVLCHKNKYNFFLLSNKSQNDLSWIWSRAGGEMEWLRIFQLSWFWSPSPVYFTAAKFYIQNLDSLPPKSYIGMNHPWSFLVFGLITSFLL